MHDLQLPKKVNKRDIVAYLFLGDKCLDCLILGSPSASLTAKANKKVKVPLFDQRKSLQIIFKKLGDEDRRFGSVTFRLSKFVGGLGSTYSHWVTLFDSLEEDTFNGQLGEDEFDMPRALLEYSIIGGKYTSTLNNLNKLRQAASGAGGEDLGMQGGGRQADGSLDEDGIREEDSESDYEDADYNLTVEYTETRADQLQGRNAFTGTVVAQSDPSKAAPVDDLKLKHQN